MRTIHQATTERTKKTKQNRTEFKLYQAYVESSQQAHTHTERPAKRRASSADMIHIETFSSHSKCTSSFLLFTRSLAETDY